MELVALRVKIGLRYNHEKKRKEHDHPDFNEVPVEIRQDLDWSVYLDLHGSGWLYDHSCGHGDEDPESPRGSWLGLILVPEDFAEAAVDAFPDRCDILDAAEVEAFYDERHACRQPELEIDERALAEVQQLEELEAQQLIEAPDAAEVERRRRVRDPSDPARGIRRNPRRRWRTQAAARGWVVKDPAALRARLQARRGGGRPPQ